MTLLTTGLLRHQLLFRHNDVHIRGLIYSTDYRIWISKKLLATISWRKHVYTYLHPIWQTFVEPDIIVRFPGILKSPKYNYNLRIYRSDIQHWVESPLLNKFFMAFDSKTSFSKVFIKTCLCWFITTELSSGTTSIRRERSVHYCIVGCIVWAITIAIWPTDHRKESCNLELSSLLEFLLVNIYDKFDNTIFVSNHYVPREPWRDPSNRRLCEHGIWYLSDTARNQTLNLFRHKREPIPLDHSHGWV